MTQIHGTAAMPIHLIATIDFQARATVAQYVALIGEEVAGNLEGIARARLEKRRRQYQSDAAVHQAYVQVTTG